MRSVEDRNREYAERDARDARRAKELEPLGLTKREYHALQGAGVNGINDLPRISVVDLLKVPQCGTGTVKGICRKLEANGIRLSGPYIHELPARLTLEQERDQLRAEVERLRKDAARYQFLRDQQSLPPDQASYAVMRWSERAGEWLHIDFKLDPEIDAYLEASK